MFDLKGKYNMAKVFTDNVDNETISQVINVLNQPFTTDATIRIMPDTHAGAGCVIGTTMTITDKIVPNLVGVDIGCGMLAAKLKETEINLDHLDKVIRQYVPSGFNIHDHAIAKSNIDKLIAPVDTNKAYKSLGTLGGGNHFIEVDKDEQGNLWLVVHTGSRHLGIEVCHYYQKLSVKSTNDLTSEINRIKQELITNGEQTKIEQAIKDLYATHTSVPDELCYVEGNNFINYLHDMKLTQEHAKINRETIVNTIVTKMGLHIISKFDTIHNYVDTENMILRKGAVSAMKDELLLIPMNMRDGSLICKGKGNPDWNYSAPHGAGRLLSRAKAKEQLSMIEFKNSMSGIYTTCVRQDTLDESPMAYKPMQEIIDNIGDTVDVIDIIKPIYNFKA